MIDASLRFVQVTSHDASKSFVEKVKADDKMFSSYPVTDRSVVLHFFAHMDSYRADTTNSPMSPMAWTRSLRTRSSRGSMPASRQRRVRRRRSFERSHTNVCTLDHNRENHKLGTRMYIYLVALSSRRIFPLPLQAQQDLLEPRDVSGIRSSPGDSFAL